MSEQKFTIFISSPTDVEGERARASKVIERLNGEFEGRIELEPIRWEDSFYTADKGFQDKIPSPDKTDLVICILWKRLGSYLPPDYDRSDGSSRTGTEYEFEVALEGALQHDLPDLFMFRKTAKVMYEENEIDEQRAQKAALDAFWNRWFHDEDGHFTAGFQSFKTENEFEEQFEAMLRGWVEQRLSKVVWPIETMGSPYLGLAPFTEKHAPVFFGRRRATKQLRAKLLAAASREDACAYLLILGMSGSGKSSLARAGLIPTVTRAGSIPDVDDWRKAVFRPNETGGDVCQAFAEALYEKGALPELAKGDFTTAKALAKAFREEGEKPIVRAILAAIGRIADDLKAREKRDETPCIRFFLLVDQLEELFSSSEGEKSRIGALLSSLARSGSVWVTATMRSDFYALYQTVPDLVDLKDDGSTFDLLHPTPVELSEMIEGPAEAAGLAFEMDAETGENLADILAKEANQPGVLPLMAIMLESLYQRRDPETKMLLDSVYDELGGVEGVIGTRADQIFDGLPVDVQGAFPFVMRQLVQVTRKGEATARTVPLKIFPEGAARQLIYAFVAPEARLLVITGDGTETHVHVAHEALLRNWERATDQIEKDLHDLQARSRLEQRSELYYEGKPEDQPGLLLAAGGLLSEAEDLLNRRREELTKPVVDFVEVSLDVDRKKREAEAEAERNALRLEAENQRKIARVTRAGAIVATVLMLLAAGLGVYSYIQKELADEEKREATIAQYNLVARNAEEALSRGDFGLARALVLEVLPSGIADDEDFPLADRALSVLDLALATDPTVVTLRAEYHDIERVFFSPNGKRAAVVDTLDNAYIFDAHSGLLLATHFGVDDIIFLPQQEMVAVIRDGSRIQIYWDNSENMLHEFFRSEDRIEDLIAYSGDIPWLIILSENGTLELWEYNVAEDQPLIVSLDDFGSSGEIIHFSASQLPGKVVFLGSDNVARWWDPDAGETDWLFEFEDQILTDFGYSDNLLKGVTLAYDPATSSMIADIWDYEVVTEGEIIISLGVEDEIYISEDAGVDISKDGRYVFISSDSMDPVLIDVDLRYQLRINASFGNTYSMRSDGNIFASYFLDNFSLWRPTGQRLWNIIELNTDEDVADVVFSADGEHVLVGFDRGQARIWNIPVQNEVLWLPAEQEQQIDMGQAPVLSTDGRKIQVILGETDSAQGEGTQITIFDLASRSHSQPLRISSRSKGDNCSRDFRICMGSFAGILSVYDLSGETPERGSSIMGDAYLAPSGEMVLSRSGNKLTLYSIPDNQELATLPDISAVHGFLSDDAFVDFHFPGDGSLILLEINFDVYVWNWASGEVNHIPTDLNALIVIPNMARNEFILISQDRYLERWDVSSLRRIQSFGSLLDRYESAGFSRDGSKFYMKSWTGEVVVVDDEGINFRVPGRGFNNAIFDITGSHILTQNFEDFSIWNIETGLRQAESTREVIFDDLDEEMLFPSEDGKTVYIVAADLIAQINAPESRINDDNLISYARATTARILGEGEQARYDLSLSSSRRTLGFIAEPKSSAHQCDLLAADPDDPERYAEGNLYGYIDHVMALPECREAVNGSPDEPRFHYQLARVMKKAGQDDWLTEARMAVEAGYGIAKVFMARAIIDDEPEAAFDLIKSAMDDDVPSAHYEMGVYHYFGDEALGIEENNYQAFHHWMEAMRLGDYDAATFLARVAHDPPFGIDANPPSAVFYATLGLRVSDPARNVIGYYRFIEFRAAIARSISVEDASAAWLAGELWQIGDPFPEAYIFPTEAPPETVAMPDSTDAGL